MHPATQPHHTVEFLNVHFPSHWPAQADLLTWCHSAGPLECAILVIMGVIYLLFGINIYKLLVMLNAGLIGAAIGAHFGDLAGNAPVGAVVGAFTAAMVSWPYMKYAVAIMGGITGALIGASVWRSSAPHPELYWAGAISGGVLFGLLSFSLFNGCVMMYTSLQGSVMIVFGLLGLILKYPAWEPELQKTILVKPFILPLAVFIPALLGLIYQHTPSAAAAAAAKKK